MAQPNKVDSRQEPMACIDTDTIDVDIELGSDAMRLHMQIKPDRWCVTRDDLLYLRNEISKAVEAANITQQGNDPLWSIMPTARDPFDPADNRIGPNVYTVNEQYIKPVTDAAGGMSWALMRHRDGLPVDVFITHAWVEGMYEFVDKVLASWHPRWRHAWCCMLANPQNLDISTLISRPCDSPFAIALNHSSYMLAVPNEVASIYSRLWCVYEAFKAQELGLVVLPASPPKSSTWQTMLPIALFVAAGAASGVGGAVARTKLDIPDFCFWVYVVMWICLVSCLLLASAFSPMRFISRGGAFCAAFVLATVAEESFVGTCAARWSPDAEDTTCMHYVLNTCVTCVMNIVYFAIIELDLERGLLAQASQSQLKKGLHPDRFTEHAHCSVEADQESILAEISEAGVMDNVNKSIHILMQAGMSSGRLLRAFSAGVEVEDAAHAESGIAFLHCGFGFFLARDVMFLRHHQGLDFFLAFLLACCSAVCAYRFWFSDTPPDVRAFTRRSANKVLLLFTVVAFVPHHPVMQRDVMVLTYICISFIILMISVAGFDGIANLPFCGRKAAEFFALRGFPTLRSRLRKWWIRLHAQAQDLHSDSQCSPPNPHVSV